MQEQLIRLRILHITLLFGIALIISQFSNWGDSLWVPISVLAIVGPFRPGLSLNKAAQRVIGTYIGLILSILVWLILRYNYALVFIFAIVLVYALAFAMLQQYKYFIMLVTIVICINYDYMNLPLDFNIIYYLVNRGVCVAVGVALYVFFEYFIFRKYYTNAMLLINTVNLDKSIAKSISTFLELFDQKAPVNAEQINSCSEPLLLELTQIEETKQSATFGVSNQEQLVQKITYYENLINQVLSIYAQSSRSLINPFAGGSNPSQIYNVESQRFLKEINQKYYHQSQLAK